MREWWPQGPARFWSEQGSVSCPRLSPGSRSRESNTMKKSITSQTDSTMLLLRLPELQTSSLLSLLNCSKELKHLTPGSLFWPPKSKSPTSKCLHTISPSLIALIAVAIFHLFGDRPPLIKQTDKSLQTERTLKSKVVYFFNWYPMTFQDERIIIVIHPEKKEKSSMCYLQSLEVTWLRRKQNTKETAESTSKRIHGYIFF